MLALSDVPSISYTAVVYKEGYNYLGVHFEYVPRQQVAGLPAVSNRVAIDVNAGGDWDTMRFWRHVKRKLWRR
jgi:hypothetical protein